MNIFSTRDRALSHRSLSLDLECLRMIDDALRHEPLPKPLMNGSLQGRYVMGMSCFILSMVAVLVRSCVQKDSEHFLQSNSIAEAVRHASKAFAKFFSVDAIPDVHEKCPTAQSRC